MSSPRSPRRSGRSSAAALAILIAALGGAALVALWPPQRVEKPLQSAPSPARAPSVQSIRPQRPLARSLAAPKPEADAGAPGEAEAAPLSLFARARLSQEEERTLFEAGEKAIASCMQERGFRYLANPFVSDAELRPDAGAVAERKPGDLEGARARGYGITDALQAGQRPPPDANREAVGQLSPSGQVAWHEALEGPPIEPTGPPTRPDLGTVYVPGGPMIQWNRDSCLTRAERSLYGDDVKHTELVMMLDEARAEVDEKAQAEPAYRAGVERWRDCMSKRGLTYQEPESAAEALADDYQSGRLALDQLRKREIEVATADSACFGEAGLGTLLEAARKRAEAAVERERQGALEALIALQTQALDRAGQPASALQ